MKTRWKWYLSLLLVILIGLPFLNSLSFFGAMPDPIGDSSKNCVRLMDGWALSLENGYVEHNVRLGSFSNNPDNEKVYLRRELPDLPLNHTSLMLGLFYSSAVVTLDGQELYRFGSENGSKNPQITRMCYIFIDLPDDYAGKELVLELQTPYEMMSELLPPVYIGGRSDIVIHFLTQEFPKILCGILLVVVGVVFLIFSYLSKMKQTPTTNNVYLAKVMLFLGMWYLTECRMLTQFLNNYALIYYLNFLCFYLAFIYCIIFFHSVCAPKSKRLLKGLIAFYLSFLMAALIGEITGAFAFSQITVYFVMGILLGFMVVLAAFLLDIKKNGGSKSKLWLPILFFLATAIDFIFFYFPNTYKLEHPFYLFLITAVLLAIYIIGREFAYYIKSVQKNIINRNLEKQLESQLAHYTELYRMQEELRIFRHDYQNHMRTISHLLQKNEVRKTVEYLDELTASQATKSSILATGNPVMDAIITEKEMLALSLGITFCKEIRVCANMKLSPVDFVSLLGNGLDNAIEACQYLQGEKTIRLTMQCSKGILHLQIVNSTDRKSLRQTTKQEKHNHGFGLQSMRDTVHQYHGTFKVSFSEGRCCLEALLFGVVCPQE